MKLKQRLGIIFVAIAITPYLTGVLYILTSTSAAMRKNAIGFLSEYTGHVGSQQGALFTEYTGMLTALRNLPDLRTLDWEATREYLTGFAESHDRIGAFIVARNNFV